MLLSKKIVLFIFIVISFSNSGNAAVGEQTKNGKEFVYVLHGLGRGSSSMWLLASRLEDAGFSVKRIDYKSLNKTPEEVLSSISNQIDSTMPKNSIIHFVGHSLGGLMIRAYLDKHKIKNLGNVVLIGTPNQGTEFIDKFNDTWWLKLLGPMTLSLGTDKDSFPNSLKPPYYPVGIIAGESKVFNNDKIIPGKDDGMVPIESAKLEGMTDMIIINTNHIIIKHKREVSKQTIEFLKNSKFNKD